MRSCSTYFNQFSDAILKNEYPIRVTPINSSDTDLYWHSNYGATLKSLPNCFDINGEPLPKKEINSIVAKNFISKGQQYSFYDKTLISNRNRWIRGELIPQKIQAYNLIVFCFFQVYLGFTASNVQTALDLKISDVDMDNIGSKSFAKKHKFRSGREVDFLSSGHLKKEFKKYFKIREWVESLGLSGNVKDYIFVTIGEDLTLRRLDRGGSSWIIKKSALFSEIPILTSSEIRQVSSEYFVKKSKGKISLVAKKLNNSIATVAQSYTSIDLKSQAVEMNAFHDAMVSKVKNFNRVSCDPIPVDLVRDVKVLRVASGSCSNIDGYNPIRKEGFNAESPEPSCGTFESCLFCEYFAVHTDFEDVSKLLSLREALLITSSIRNDPEHHEAVVYPSVFRIEEIMDFMSKNNDYAEELIRQAEEQVEMGVYNIHWKKQIESLLDRNSNESSEFSKS